MSNLRDLPRLRLRAMIPPTARAPSKQYFCPGEAHPISRSVHLARLAAYFPACRDCPLRSDVGQLSIETRKRLDSTRRRVPRPSLFTTEGVRGVHLNELTRPLAAKMATAFAHLLWEDYPRPPGPDENATQRSQGSSAGPTPAVVVAYDERPSAPDLVTGVVAALRRMSCRVIDIRQATTPIFRFAVDHLRASGGIFVTGSGQGPSWIGLDFVRAGGEPLSRGHGGLERLEAELHRPHARPTRHGGAYRTFQAALPYETGLWKHFHALRPLRIICGMPLASQRRLLERLFERLPCTLIAVELPVRKRALTDPADPDIRRVAEQVRAQQGHLGLVIDDDGQACSFIDEEGGLVPNGGITRLIAEVMLHESPARRIAIADEELESLRGPIQALGGEPVAGGTTQGGIWQALSAGAIYGSGGGRHWFHEPAPTSDAVLALARVLQALSRSDAEFSAVASGASSGGEG